MARTSAYMRWLLGETFALYCNSGSAPLLACAVDMDMEMEKLQHTTHGSPVSLVKY